MKQILIEVSKDKKLFYDKYNLNNDKHKLSLNELWNGKKLKDYRSEWKKGNLPDICKNCDRYQPVNEFVKQNKYYPHRFKMANNVLHVFYSLKKNPRISFILYLSNKKIFLHPK